MSCLFEHRWMYDFRLYHVYRKCQFCNVAQRHVRNKESVYTAWEPVRERTDIEPEQRPSKNALPDSPAWPTYWG